MSTKSLLSTFAVPATLALAAWAQGSEAALPEQPAEPAAAQGAPCLVPEMSAEPEERAALEAELRGALEHYRRTGEARYASPRFRVTPLHAAALCHDQPLIEELVLKGADPNARMQLVLWYRGEAEAAPHAADTPLTLALRNPRDASAASAQELTRTTFALLQLGADIAAEGYRDRSALACLLDGLERADERAGQTASPGDPTDPANPASPHATQVWEGVALLLVRLGAPADSDDALCFLNRRWVYTFCALMHGPQGEALRREPTSLARRFSLYLSGQDSSFTPQELEELLRAFHPTPAMLDAVHLDRNELPDVLSGFSRLRQFAEKLQTPEK